MPQAQVKMEVRRTGNASVIAVEGEMTAFAEDVLMDAYRQAAGDGTHAVVLDFSGLQYMNSSGIGLLVTLLIRANREDRRLLTCGLSEHYREIFRITRLDDAISIHDTEAEAVGAAERIRR